MPMFQIRLRILAPTTTDTWILATGDWNDSGVWVDNAIWID